MTRTSLTIRQRLLGAAIFVGYAVLLLSTAPDLAMSRDESFYAHAARDYGSWLDSVASDPGTALTREAIDRAWKYNWEHPALMKLAFASSWLAHEKFNWFSSDSLAIRLPAIVCAALLLWLIFVWGTETIGVRGGLLAALSFGLMPRVFYHSHLAAFDVPIAFFSTLTVYAYWRSLSDRRWAPLAGLAFGLAMATKHNSWMLPGIFAVHFVWVRVQHARAAKIDRPSIAWLPWMLTLGPAILIATWPWVWHDTWSRLAAYVRFHLHHVHYTYAYFGVSYYEPPLPISVPFVMTAFTVPLTVLCLAAIGVAMHRRALTPPWKARPGDSVDARVEVLWVGALLAPMLAVALPTSPIFGGTKHWITAYPFLALFAGCGFVAIVEVAKPARVWARRSSAWALGLLCLAPSVLQTADSHPFGLSHYTPLAGGVPGAASLGMNRQFWGFTTGSLADWLTARLPDGGTVWPGDTTWGAWSMMQADGQLPENIRPARSLAAADLVLVHHESHFREVDYQAWVAFDDVRPAYVLTYDGVPIISVYENAAR
ncbi:MAG: glycosyltransferase family 39 protein [Polyangiales bacterium]